MKLRPTFVKVALGATLLSGGVAASAASASPAHPAPPVRAVATPATDAQLRAQVETNGLTTAQASSLQARVDAVVSRTGGIQVAINQVQWDGGDTLVPLSGETRARELGQRGITPAATVNGCKYLQFCTYSGKNYPGIRPC